MTVLLLALGAAWARPTEATARQYLDWYATNEHDRLWEAASDEYRERHCLGDPAQCPRLGGVVLGEEVSASLSCDGRRRCTFTRTDRYDTPPLPYSEATQVDWIVTTDLDGRYQGVAVDYREPGAFGRAAVRLVGVGCGFAITFGLVWGLLVALLRAGSRPVER